MNAVPWYMLVCAGLGIGIVLTLAVEFIVTMWRDWRD